MRTSHPLFPWVSALVAGLASGYACLPYSLVPADHLIALVAFVPLWWFWLNATTLRSVVITGFAAQFIFSLVAMNWIAHTVREFGGLPWPAAIGVMMLYASIANLHLPLAAALWFRLFRRQTMGARLLGLVATTAVLEMAWPKIFDWNLGYAWYFSKWPAFQLADVVGFAGLGTLSWFLNGMALAAIRAGGRQKIYWSASIAGFLAALTLLGMWRISALPQPDASVSALVVQANIGNKEKLEAEVGQNYRISIVRKYIALTRAALQDTNPPPDFVVWPENAFPDVLHELGSLENHYEHLRAFRREINLPIVTGAFGWSFESDQVTNGFFVLEKGVSWQVPHYFKTQLLAFGEYVPGDRFFPALKTLFPAVRNFGRGQGPKILDVAGIRVGPQICYEGSSPGFSRRSAQIGAQILVNLTNDSWYGTWQQPAQHLYLTAARAVETRLPLLRSTNTGHSAVVLADGSWMQLSPLHQEWAHVYKVAYRRQAPNPPFLSWGAWLLPVFSSLLWIILFLFRRKAK